MTTLACQNNTDCDTNQYCIEGKCKSGTISNKTRRGRRFLCIFSKPFQDIDLESDCSQDALTVD